MGNEMLKGKVKELESSQVALEARVAALSTAGSSSTEEKDGKNTSESAQPSSEPAAPDSVETPDAPGTNTESKPAEPETSAEAAPAAAETPNEASPAKEAQEKEGEGEAS